MGVIKAVLIEPDATKSEQTSSYVPSHRDKQPTLTRLERALADRKKKMKHQIETLGRAKEIANNDKDAKFINFDKLTG